MTDGENSRAEPSRGGDVSWGGPVFAMVYRSVATRSMSDDDLARLLEHCRARNTQLEVTGMLLYRDGRFMQFLEGEEVTVRSLMETICVDRRHEDVLTLWAEYNDRRFFPDWSMGFRSLERLPPREQQGFSDVMDRPVDALELIRTPTAGHELLGLFRRAT